MLSLIIVFDISNAGAASFHFIPKHALGVYINRRNTVIRTSMSSPITFENPAAQFYANCFAFRRTKFN